MAKSPERDRREISDQKAKAKAEQDAAREKALAKEKTANLAAKAEKEKAEKAEKARQEILDNMAQIRKDRRGEGKSHHNDNIHRYAQQFDNQRVTSCRGTGICRPGRTR
jgi:hypothetical protein